MISVVAHKCTACGGKHAKVELTRLKGFAIVGTEKVTHVFQCPKTNEAVYVVDVPGKKA